MSHEDEFIRIYCEIAGVSESTARCAFVTHDAVTPDAAPASPARMQSARLPNGNGSRTGGAVVVPTARAGFPAMHGAARAGLNHGTAPLPAAA